MNRFYLFNTWVMIFFIVLTVLFFAASFFYILQLYLLNKKNKRFKKQNHPEFDERKRTYIKNIKLADKLDGNEKILTSINKKDLKELTKKTKRDVNKAKTKKSLSCLEVLFKSKKRKELTEPHHYSLNEENYLSESRNYYADQTDGQQSYESFETMTTDSECYRDWRHSIDFMSNGILNLNNHYNNHNNEIMQKAYEQLYSQQYKNSNLVLNKPINNEINLPVDDLYPVSVVPYDFEPQSIHVYQMNEPDEFNDKMNKKRDNLEFNLKDNQKNINEYLQDNQDQGYNSSQHLSNNVTNNQPDKVNKQSFDEAINKLSTLVSIKNDGKIKQKVLTSAEAENLDRNMNLLTQN